MLLGAQTPMHLLKRLVTGSRLKDRLSLVFRRYKLFQRIFIVSRPYKCGRYLQTSTSAGGQQMTSLPSGFVLDNGPGSRTVNLRDLEQTVHC